MRGWIVAGAVAVLLVLGAALIVPVRDGESSVVPFTVTASEEGHCGEVTVDGTAEVGRRVPLIDTGTIVSLDATLLDPTITVSPTDACDGDVDELEGWASLVNPRCGEPWLPGPEEDAAGGFTSGAPGSDLGTRCDGTAIVMRVRSDGPDGASASWVGDYSLGSSGAELVGGDMVWCIDDDLGVTVLSGSVLEGRAVEPETPTCFDQLAS
ncbi:hypothetical protein [Demequina sp. NBRC 110053]|uniref:hypothetical protein n=1 Tax=Demequina sp. NBRC 110053 TaxID=1570342 RepID=UPI0009FD6B6E|nr:hypothetical protein [Demequina sp. NBRC 110053]